MEAYRKQSKEALELLCQEKNLPTFGKNKAQLIADLVEADSHIFQPETDTERVTELPTTAGVLLTEMPGGCTPQNIKDICSTDLFRQLMAANPQEALHVMIQQQAAERESAEREAQRRHELELAKLQFTLQSSLNSNASESSTRRLRKDDFPSLEEGTDLDVFLKSFEKVCRQHQLPSDQWGRYLTPQLKGKALDVFVSLPPETDNNYEAIKSALQKTFNLTPESNRKKFRSMQQCPSSSCILYVAQLETTFRQWVTGVQATTYEALNDLLVLEQFLQTRSPNVREWILERKPKNARAAAELADDYADIHAPTSRRGLVSAATSTWREATVQSPLVRSAVRTSPPTASVAGATSSESDARRCFRCNQIGHLSRTCPTRNMPSPVPDTVCEPEGLTAPPKVLCETLGDIVKCDCWEGEQGVDKYLPVTEPVMSTKCEIGVSSDVPVLKYCEAGMSESKGEEEDESQGCVPLVAVVTSQQWVRAAAGQSEVLCEIVRGGPALEKKLCECVQNSVSDQGGSNVSCENVWEKPSSERGLNEYMCQYVPEADVCDVVGENVKGQRGYEGGQRVCELYSAPGLASFQSSVCVMTWSESEGHGQTQPVGPGRMAAGKHTVGGTRNLVRLSQLTHTPKQPSDCEPKVQSLIVQQAQQTDRKMKEMMDVDTAHLSWECSLSAFLCAYRGVLPPS
ncbi:71 kDa [Pelobates cultripes]|uniref:71 kDa n=1 Tax=Pelobates cultripes TaxID=61616 RepID=A0AAD1VQY1_PELCU|nr:71 kDa [Pelobates cultripes]